MSLAGLGNSSVSIRPEILPAQCWGVVNLSEEDLDQHCNLEHHEVMTLIKCKHARILG